jgi:mono/diheme cytochrome c family protein
VSEVPEHLLRRSRERRAALGLGGEEGEGAPAPAASAAPAVAAESAPEAAAPRGAVAVVEEAPPEPVPATPPPPPRRPGLPLFALVLLVALPVYAFIYLGAFGNRSKAAAGGDPVALGGTLFAANCAVCHGASGEGGVGPKLSGGEVLKTWPNVNDHVTWVHTGGAPFVGKSYGSQGHTVAANNVMPAFGQDHGGSLSNDQINDIVCYERIGLSGAPDNAQNCPASGAAPSS